MVGGNGERRTLRTLARHGDVMNLDEATPAQVTHKIGVLEEHCREIGRDPAEITKTCFFAVALQDDEAKAEHLRGLWDRGKTPEERARLAIGPAEHVIDVIREYEATGVERVIFKGMPNNPPAVPAPAGRGAPPLSRSESPRGPRRASRLASIGAVRCRST